MLLSLYVIFTSSFTELAVAAFLLVIGAVLIFVVAKAQENAPELFQGALCSYDSARLWHTAQVRGCRGTRDRG